ncbi:TPA: helix-turn-helix transcriptional regulator [Vibrio harveyi]|nr:helix-turn-helix transcriptional regulator [Vibrio harveyi]
MDRNQIKATYDTIRAENGIRAYQVANRMNKSPQSLNRSLKSPSPRLSTILELCTALGVTPSYFFETYERLGGGQRVG